MSAVGRQKNGHKALNYVNDKVVLNIGYQLSVIGYQFYALKLFPNL